jgi:hypothetical protein
VFAGLCVLMRIALHFTSWFPGRGTEMHFPKRQFFQGASMACANLYAQISAFLGMRVALEFVIAYSNRISPTVPALRLLPGGQAALARHAWTSFAGISA